MISRAMIMSSITQGGTLHELITSGQGTGIDYLSW
jgi:hypothetical protein